MIKTTWTKEQFTKALKVILMRLQQDSSSFQVKEGANGDITLSQNLTSDNKSIYVSLSNNHIYMSLSGRSDGYSLSDWPWSDTELKNLRDQIVHLATKNTESEKILVECLPEIVTEEFEKHFLGDKDGKSKK